MKSTNLSVLLAWMIGLVAVVSLFLFLDTAVTQSIPLTAVSGSIRYVAETGTDEDSCTLASSPCRSVQYAVDQADEGDEIRIAAGTYTGVHIRPRQDITSTGMVTQVVYLSKTVAIQGGYTPTNWSTADPDANPTILDAQDQGRVLYITGHISPTIMGLHITGGNDAGLGGDGRWGGDAGGGVFVISATAVIKENNIFSNTANFGGGIFLSASASTLENNIIRDNDANSSDGGGIGVQNNDLATIVATIDGNLIEGNISSWGGGLSVYDGPIIIKNNIIRDNEATGRGGGGLFLFWSDATIDANLISGNESSYGGGGVFSYNSSPTFINNVVVDNQADSGGSFHIEGHNPKLIHTTIARNVSNGASIYVTDGVTPWESFTAHVTLTNTIFVSHSVGISVTGGNSVAVNGILWHNTPITVSQALTATSSFQNQYWGDPGFDTDGYHITPGSAAVDVGVEVHVSTDIDAHFRPYNVYPDLGADELIAAVVPPDVDSTLIFTDTQGSVTAVHVPTGAVTEAVDLVYTPVPTAETTGFAFAGHAFELDAYQNDSLLADYEFNGQITITIQYADADLSGMNESSLTLTFWNEASEKWEDAACGPYQRNLGDNRMSVPICHLSQFALFGQHMVYLPAVIKN